MKINTKMIPRKMNNKKQRLSGIIFARAFCSIGIVIYHYFGISKGTPRFFLFTANSSWGQMFVTSFFCISGTVLYYNYPKINSYKTFYYKRWKSIFPTYYFCFLFFYLKNIFAIKKIFYKGHWSKLIFTILGLDGYFFYRYDTYFLVGEWFIGAILIIYLLYPILLWSINNNFLIMELLLSIGFLFMYKTNYFVVRNWRNIITCINSFYFGMISIKLRKIFFSNIKVFLFSFVILIVLCLIKISSCVILIQIQGFSLYIILVQLGQKIMQKKISIVIKEISTLSYCIFLFQHRILWDLFGLYNPTKWYFHLILLSIAIILTIICSKILFIIVYSFIQSYAFQKLEYLIISQNL